MLNSATTTFFSHLEKSNLLTAEQLQQLRAQAERGGDAIQPQQIAQRLVAQSWLTKWQAQMLLGGRKAFFLGKYKLLDRVGQGGMGAVFKAEQTVMGRVVALKVMSRNVVKDTAAVNRFHREIEAAAALNHPNIVLAYDADCAQDTHFLVMEFVAGEDLDSLVKRQGSLPVSEACEYIRQAAQGLQHAHERGMVHRDIKPSNLLLTKNADGGALVKILDMGLARLASETSGDGGLTQTGQIMGTPDYIAPEQARNTKAADIRSDIFSLGCTLFRLLTGKLPFNGDNVMEKLMARATTDAPPVSSLRKSAPAELDAVVARMLHRNPAQRYQTPVEVVAALANFLTVPAGGSSPDIAALARSAESAAALSSPGSGSVEIRASTGDSGMDQFLQHLATEIEEDSQPAISTQNTTHDSSDKTTPRVTTTGASSSRIATRSRRRSFTPKQLAVFVAPLVAIVLIAGVVVFWNKSNNARLLVDWPESQRLEGAIELDGRSISLPAKGEIVFDGEAGKRSLVLTRKGYQTIENKLTLTPGETKTIKAEWQPLQETTRRAEMAALQKEIQAAASKLTQLPRQFDATEQFAFRTKVRDFATRWVGTPDATSAIKLACTLPTPFDSLKTTDIPAYESENVAGGAGFSPPNELVSVFGDSRWKTMIPVYAMAVSSNGKWLATGSNDRRVRLWDVATGKIAHRFEGEGGTIQAVAFSPNCELLAAGGDANTIRLWNVTTQKEIGVWMGHTERVRSIAFHPKGDLLATTGNDKTLIIWEAASGKIRRTVQTGHTRSVVAVAFSPDGKHVATGSEDKLIKFWDPATGSERLTLTDSNSVFCLAFSPDSRTLATGNADRMIKLWDVATGNEKSTWPGHSDQVRGVAFSPDGKTLASSGNQGDRTVRLWDVASGNEKHVLTGHAERVMHVAFAPDGRTVYSGSDDGSVRLWDVSTGLAKFQSSAHDGGVTSIDISPSATVLATGSGDGSAILWDIATQKPLHTLRGHKSRVLAVAFSPDGKTLATGGDDQMIVLWDAKTTKEIRTLIGHTTPVVYLTFAPDGKTLLSGGRDRGAILWDLASGNMSKQIQKPGPYYGSTALSPDGKTIAVGGNQSSAPKVDITLFELAQATPVTTLTTGKAVGTVRSVAFHPNGTMLASLSWANGDNCVRVWDIAKSQVLHEVTGSMERTSVTFSPDGELLAWSHATGGLRVINPRDPKKVTNISLPDTSGYFREVRFSPEGRHLLTANNDGTVYVLRLQAWKPAEQSAKAR